MICSGREVICPLTLVMSAENERMLVISEIVKLVGPSAKKKAKMKCGHSSFSLVVIWLMQYIGGGLKERQVCSWI